MNRAVIFVLAVCASPAAAWAETYYVSPIGVAGWAQCEENGATAGP